MDPQHAPVCKEVPTRWKGQLHLARPVGIQCLSGKRRLRASSKRRLAIPPWLGRRFLKPSVPGARWERETREARQYADAAAKYH
jgi:hypothetical protein